MRCPYSQLPARLKAAGRSGLYTVSGDEPYQRGRALDLIRAAVRAEGYADRQVFDVDAGFDWSQITGAQANGSLFGDRRLLEIRMTNASPGVRGTAVLAALEPGEDLAVLVELPRMKKASQSTEWFRRLETRGLLVEVWPLSQQELRPWLAAQARERGLQLSAAALGAIEQRVEGNLLAAVQEVERLSLLLGKDPADDTEVIAALSDNARFEVDQLLEAALQGQLARSVRIAQALRAEGAEPTLVLWITAQRIRELGKLAAGGEPAPWQAARGPLARRTAALAEAAKRRPDVSGLLRRCARIDRINKGMESGRAWDELLELLSILCGRPLLPSSFPSP